MGVNNMFTIIIATIVGAITIILGLAMLIAIGFLGLYMTHIFDCFKHGSRMPGIKEFFLDWIIELDVFELILIGCLTFAILIVFMLVGTLVISPLFT